MRRRPLLFASAAAAAAAAGLGLSVWRSSVPVVAPAPPDPFWSLAFDTPDGARLNMRDFAGKRLLVNFWATWCPPCVEELPLLDAFYRQREAEGWQVLGLAVDQPSAVRAWLAKSPLAFPIGMAGLSGTELSKRMGNLSGGLPFSLVFGRSGEVLHRKTGQLTEADLSQWAGLA
jgi:thiol-disulfide isomerase/thioredoxin